MAIVPTELIYFGNLGSDNNEECACGRTHNAECCLSGDQDGSSYIDLLADIRNTLENHDEVNCSNALELNRHMQKQLLDMRLRLVILLKEVKKRYFYNADSLSMSLHRPIGVGQSGAYLKGSTFHFKGNMFFKDFNYRNAPNNVDYMRRSTIEKEMFPMDFDLCSRHIWSISDKVGLVQAVKEQVLDFIRSRENRYLDKKDKVQRITMLNELHTKRLVYLLAQVDESFRIDWNEISALGLRYRHTATSCKAMWNIYLKPSLRRQNWTSEENERLKIAMERYKYQNWAAIAQTVGKRSEYQCFIQSQTCARYMQPKPKSRWNKKDDQLLLDLTAKYTINGVINWNAVITHFPNRPKQSLIAHYTYSLNPQISHKPFTPEEDLLLLAAVKQYGTRFSCLPRTLFPNRSIIQLRARYTNTLQNRHKMTTWSLEDDMKLLEFVKENGTSAWLKCAETLGNHVRTSCRTRFLTIKRFLEKNPNATIYDLPRRNKLNSDNVITSKNWEEKVSALRSNPAGFCEKRIEKKKTATSNRKTHKEKLKTEAIISAEIQAEPYKRETTEKDMEKLEKIATEPSQPKKKKRSKRPALNETKNNNKEAYKKRRIAYKKYGDDGDDNRSGKSSKEFKEFLGSGYYFRLDHKTEIYNNLKLSRCPKLLLQRAANALECKLPSASNHLPYHKYLTLRAQKRISTKYKKLSNNKRMIGGATGPIPPSLSALISVRAQLINAANVKTETDPVELIESAEHSASIDLFRQRFRTLFSRTVELIKMPPTAEKFAEIQTTIPEIRTKPGQQTQRYTNDILQRYRLMFATEDSEGNIKCGETDTMAKNKNTDHSDAPDGDD